MEKKLRKSMTDTNCSIFKENQPSAFLLHIKAGFELVKQNQLAKSSACSIEKGLPQVNIFYGFVNHFNEKCEGLFN